METTDMQAIREAIERELGHMQSRHDDSVGALRDQLRERMDSLRNVLPLLDKIDKSGEGDPDAHLSDEAYLTAKQERFAKGGLAHVDPDKYMEEARGTGMVLTDEEMEDASHRWANTEPPWPGPVERTYARTVFKDGLRYARDNGYLAPAKAPAEVVDDVIMELRELEKCDLINLKEGDYFEIENALRQRFAALKSNTPEHGN